MLFALFVPNIASAEIVTTTYDFAASAYYENTTVSTGDKTITISGTKCTYYTQLGDVSDYFGAGGGHLKGDDVETGALWRTGESHLVGAVADGYAVVVFFVKTCKKSINNFNCIYDFVQIESLFE